MCGLRTQACQPQRPALSPETIANAYGTEWEPPHQTLTASLETPLPSVSQTQGDGSQGHPLPPGPSACTTPGNRCAFPAPGARKRAAAQTYHTSQPRPAGRWVPLSTFQVSPGHRRGPRRSRAVGVRGPWPPRMHAHGLVPYRAWPGAWSPSWVTRPHTPNTHPPCRASEASKSWSTVWRQREGKSEAAWGNEGSGPAERALPNDTHVAVCVQPALPGLLVVGRRCSSVSMEPKDEAHVSSDGGASVWVFRRQYCAEGAGVPR